MRTRVRAAVLCYSALHIALPLRAATTSAQTCSAFTPRHAISCRPQSARLAVPARTTTMCAAPSPDLADNPLATPFALPPFTAVTPKHVEPAMEKILADLEAGIAALEEKVGTADQSALTWDDVVAPAERIEAPLGAAWGVVSHLMGVKNSDELRAAHAKMQPEVVKASTRMGQSRALFDGAVAIRDGKEWDKLSATRKQVLTKLILDAKLTGVALEGAEKERFNEVQTELAALATKFSNNVLDSTKVFSMDLTKKEEVDGLPESCKELLASTARDAGVSEKATPKDGPWRVTLDFPSFMPFMTHSTQRDLREKVYRAYVTRASSGEHDNVPLIDKILALRVEEAKLLGFKNYAELSLAPKMAESPAQVNDLLEELLGKSHSKAVEELAELKAFAKGKGAPEGDDMQLWDMNFWAERLREEKYAFSDEQLRPYFPLPKVLDGLFGYVERLFEVKVVPADGEADVWHPDVKFFKLLDKDGAHRASFFLDPYSRPGDKRGGAWMDDAVSRSAVLRNPDGSKKVPVAYLVCNGSPPVDGKPSLMTFREVETLFHEAGHGLQHMLTEIDERRVTGINGVEWDAVETASQFNEYWCYHRPTLMGMTGHYETGEPLPDDLFQKIVQAKTYRAASAMLRQLNFAMLDMQLHSTYNPEVDGNPFDLQNKMSARTSVLPPLPEDRFLCAFSHIFAGGYSAGYFSYKWAEVLAADAFAKFEEAGLDDDVAVVKVGKEYKSTILALGGSRPAMDVFVDFRGRKPETAALLRHAGLAS